MQQRVLSVIKSEPCVVDAGEREADLAERIIARLKDNGAKGYRDNTVLIVKQEDATWHAT